MENRVRIDIQDEEDFNLPETEGKLLDKKELPELEEDEVSELQGKIDNLTAELEKREGEFTELNDKALRALAEAENYKKRLAKEGDEARRYAAISIIESLLPALENLEKAVDASKIDGADIETLRVGVDMVHKQFMDALGAKGLGRLKVVGKPFDPELCEAMGVIETDEFEDGIVVNEFLPGYRFKDRVIRHAKVQIAKSPAEQEK